MNEALASAVREIAAMAQASTAPVSIENGKPFVIVPEGYVVEDISSALGAPIRKSGTVEVHNADSLCAYAKLHGSEDATSIYAVMSIEEGGKGSMHLSAVLDDHSQGGPGWKEHRCEYAAPLSIEWKRWTSKNRQLMSQSDFAAWIEDNLDDIREVDGSPSGSAMLKMAVDFEANSNKAFRSKVSMQDGGVRLEFVDEEKSETRQKMQAFERFTIVLPVFDGSKTGYPVEARLKYRNNGAKLTLWYELIRADRVFRESCMDVIAHVIEETKFRVINGRP